MSEKRLRRLLASRTPAAVQELETWMQSTLPENAAPRLAEIAQQAVPVWRLRRIYLYLFLLITAGYTGVVLLMHTLWDESWSDAGFSGGTILSGLWTIVFTLGAARPGRQASLLLARTGDQRAVEHLARLWIPNPWTRKQAKDNAQVTGELTRILAERQGERYSLNCETALRDLLKRSFPGRKGLGRFLLPTRDLNEADAELLLLVARHISHKTTSVSVRSDAKADEAALERIASPSAKTGHAGVNRALLRDTAQELLTVSARKGIP